MPITYETRQGSKDYLDRLDEDDASSNIDFFHMFRAYRCIEEWFTKFDHRTTHEATRLYGYLFDHVKVLWYEAPPEVDSTDLFTRLNVGRIPLTDAELSSEFVGTRATTDRPSEAADDSSDHIQRLTLALTHDKLGKLLQKQGKAAEAEEAAASGRASRSSR